MSPPKLLCVALVALVALVARAEMPPEERKRHIESFDYVWRTIQSKHFDPNHLKKVDWDGARSRFRPKVESAASAAEVREALTAMIATLGQTHFGIVPGNVYGKIETNPAEGGATTGIDLRVLAQAEAVVVRVESGSAAELAGVKPGWVIGAIGGVPVAPVIQTLAKQFANSTLFDIVTLKGLLGRLDGPPGSAVKIDFTTATGPVTLTVERRTPRGVVATFGHLPPQRIWIDTRRVGAAGYVRFNMFLDPARLMPAFNDFVSGCIPGATGCKGFVIDLRGNPGGIGGMSMGMAGWFVSGENQKLGSMTMQGGNKISFAISPRAETFDGPLAILVDGCSGSTSEILAAGMQDLHRARLFGSKTAGAALPSVFERLPNGDGFQYAMADYVSAGGRPLEGIGVTPDEEILLTRKALEAGRDPVLDRALEWIKEHTK